MKTGSWPLICIVPVYFVEQMSQIASFGQIPHYVPQNDATIIFSL